jgi:segregation and condensation protein B
MTKRDPAGTDAPEDPRSILEALLFVGNADGQPLGTREAAALIGGVTPEAVQDFVDELNAAYEEEGAAYRIVREGGGLRMALREEFERVRQRFYARVREARLSQAAIDVLSVVAYRQPIRGDEVDAFRGTKSGAILAQLVRRQLLAIERPADSPRNPLYRTTDRFLRLYGLTSLDDLPRIELLTPEEE